MLFVLLLVSCGYRPQTISELKSEFVTLGTPVCRHTIMITSHQGALVDVDEKEWWPMCYFAFESVSRP